MPTAPTPARNRRKPTATVERSQARQIAVVGAGMAGVTCARTLVQAGHRVTLIEKSRGFGGRMATRSTEFGSFDHGAQFFTVRDPRFELALSLYPQLVQAWKTSTVRVLDERGQTMASAQPPRETHWLPTPGMNALVRAWAEPLVNGHLNAAVHLNTRVEKIESDALHPTQWQLRCETADGGQQVLGGFDQVVLALPHPQAGSVLKASGLALDFQEALHQVAVAPCWTLMLAFPQAMQPNLPHFGPKWNTARSEHHRISWLTRENGKPGRTPVERWTVQANPRWSERHINDDAERVKAKLLKGFAEITGIRATPSHAVVHRWLYAQTQRPLGRAYLLNPTLGLAVCGDWCQGHRVEDAFTSGLDLALAMA
jgi:renalase